MVTAGPAASAKGRDFRGKLAEAGKRMNDRTPETGKRSQKREAGKADLQQKSTASRDAVIAQPPLRGRTAQPSPVALSQRRIVATADIARRRRRFKTTTPKSVRRRILQQMKGLGLTLVDLWSDPADCTVTLIVAQPGFSDARFLIEHNNSVWRVSIKTASDADTMTLLDNERSLQARFDANDLGGVTLSLAPD